MSQQKFKGPESGKNNQQILLSPNRQSQTSKRNRHSEAVGPPQYLEAVRIFLGPKTILSSHRVSKLTKLSETGLLYYPNFIAA